MCTNQFKHNLSSALRNVISAILLTLTTRNILAQYVGQLMILFPKWQLLFSHTISHRATSVELLEINYLVQCTSPLKHHHRTGLCSVSESNHPPAYVPQSLGCLFICGFGHQLLLHAVSETFPRHSLHLWGAGQIKRSLGPLQWTLEKDQ